MFSMWLVQNGIANLLSVPYLEQQGCQITYGTNTFWAVSFPNGLKLKFKKDTGVCERFPYVNLENLEEHVISDRMSGTPKLDDRSGLHKNLASKLFSKIKAVRDTPKEKAFVFV